jgi:hypothetical protein
VFQLTVPQTELPIRIDADGFVAPKFVPGKVTEEPAEVAELKASTYVTTGESYVYPPPMVPMVFAIVTDIALPCPMPFGTWQLIDVLELHDAVSQWLLPSRVELVISPDAKLSPRTCK